MTKITDNQIKAINSNSKLTVVSASAGTGKTFVLIERIIRNILNNISLENMLIVTFTNAAANEIKTRIRDRLTRESAKNPIFLREISLISDENICTIDSFCINLVKNKIGNKNFRILSEYEVCDLEKKSIRSTIENIYKKNDKDAINMIEFFDSSNNQNEFFEILEKWNNFSKNIYNFDDFFKKCIVNLEIDESKPIVFMKNQILNKANYVYEILENILDGINCNEELMEKYYPSIYNDHEKIKDILELKEITKIIQEIQLFEFTKLRPCKDSEEKEIVKAKLQICKKEISKMKKISDLKDLKFMKKMCACFSKIARNLNDEIMKNKVKKNSFEFSDIEKMALEFLKDEKNLFAFNGLQEVIVDEYQDVNNIQNEIFNLIGKRKFFVGDYKQSIYRFRGAMPEIFESKKKEESCLVVNLDRNFRSRKQILDFVNKCFCNLMSSKTNLIEYRGNEELVYGANYIDKNEKYVNFFEIDVNDDKKSEESECDFIVKKIKTLIDNKIQVFDSGEFRNAKLSDFCVLFRNFNKYSEHIFNSFRKYKIEFKTNDLSDFINCYETDFLISILKVIDNPTLDISFALVVLNDFFGFKYENLFNIKQKTVSMNLYYAFKEYSELNFKNSKKCKEVITYIENIKKEYINNSLMGACIKIIYDMKKKININSFNLQKFIYILNEFYNSGQLINIKNFINYIYYSTNISIDNFDNRDAVLITSIHKSKGKEFPICFIGGVSSSFINDNDKVMFDPELGIAFKNNKNESNIYRDAMEWYQRYQNRSEELRVLYVALTRAKEYIFITSSKKKREKEKLIDKTIFPVLIENAKCFSDWIKLLKND